MKKILSTFTAILFCVSSFTQIIHVPIDQPTIQAGINAANTGDTVLVAEDTYLENINFKGKAITVASNFILDGDTTHINNTKIDGSQPIYPDSASVVSFISGEDTSSIISGFTITGGSGTIFPSSGIRAGGGIVCWNSGAKIVYNKVCENEISFQANTFGGGIAAGNDGGSYWIIIEYNTISNNVVKSADFAAIGGGIEIEANARINDNVIEHNHCESETFSALGGGIYCTSTENSMNLVTFQNNLIQNNTVEGGNVYGGGVYVYLSKLSMSNNIVNNNALTGVKAWGAGLCIVQPMGEINLSENEITNNTLVTENFWVGGGIYINYPAKKMEINKNVISGNFGEGNSWGGGINISYSLDNRINFGGNIVSNNNSYTGGGLHAKDAFNCKFTNNVFSNNASGASGGAIYLMETSKKTGTSINDDWSNLHKPITDEFSDTTDVVMFNNTFFMNRATDGFGGAIRCNFDLEKVYVINSIFWENEALSGPDFYHTGNIENIISYSNIDVSNINGFWSGVENINKDPLFIDEDCHIDNHLSPCTNVGIDALQINEKWYYCPPIDFEGDSRPTPSSCMPDMGADEVDEYVGVEKFEVQNSECDLHCFPNPFQSKNTIQFTLPGAGFANLEIHDITGRKIQTLHSGFLHAGEHRFVWEADGKKEGMYMLRIEVNGILESKKLLLLN